MSTPATTDGLVVVRRPRSGQPDPRRPRRTRVRQPAAPARGRARARRAAARTPRPTRRTRGVSSWSCPLAGGQRTITLDPVSHRTRRRKERAMSIDARPADVPAPVTAAAPSHGLGLPTGQRRHRPLGPERRAASLAPARNRAPPATGGARSSHHSTSLEVTDDAPDRGCPPHSRGGRAAMRCSRASRPSRRRPSATAPDPCYSSPVPGAGKTKTLIHRSPGCSPPAPRSRGSVVAVRKRAESPVEARKEPAEWSGRSKARRKPS